MPRTPADTNSPRDHRSIPRIVLIAYACNVDEGSEGGVGWAWTRLLAGIGEVWLVKLRVAGVDEAVESRIAELGLGDRVHPIYVDLPRPWPSPWVASPTGLDWPPRFARIAYVAWQLAAWRTLRRRRIEFDIAWHVTFANAWLGSVGPLLASRFVLGPVGGGVGMPWRLATVLGWRGVPSELMRAAARGAARWLNPLARLAWSRASLILAQNPETVGWLPESARSRAVIFPNAALELDGAARGVGGPSRRGIRGETNGAPVAIVVGRLIPLKGVALAIDALRHMPGWRLRIVGSGPDEARLRARAAHAGLADRVDFTGWLPRARVLEMMRDEANVLLFPSLHDEGGWAVAEASACGLPVVCLERGGALVLGGIGVRASTPGATSRRLARWAVRAAETRPEPTGIEWGIDARRASLVQLLIERGILGGASAETEG